MAQPSTRQELIDYCKRKLGHPVLEINVADEQIEDLVDDAVQFFQERHFDGVSPTYLKYKVRQEDIDRGRAKPPNGLGLETTSATANIVGTATTFTYYENSNYLQIPPDIIGINRIFHFDSTSSITNKYLMHQNLDIYFPNNNIIPTSLPLNENTNFDQSKLYISISDAFKSHLLQRHQQYVSMWLHFT